MTSEIAALKKRGRDLLNQMREAADLLWEEPKDDRWHGSFWDKGQAAGLIRAEELEKDSAFEPADEEPST